MDRKPIAFYEYPCVVQDRVFSVDYHDSKEIKQLEDKLLEEFKDADIKAWKDNKIAFEVEINEVRIFYGFKDWIFSIGLSVRRMN